MRLQRVCSSVFFVMLTIQVNAREPTEKEREIVRRAKAELLKPQPNSSTVWDLLAKVSHLFPALRPESTGEHAFHKLKLNEWGLGLDGVRFTVRRHGQNLAYIYSQALGAGIDLTTFGPADGFDPAFRGYNAYDTPNFHRNIHFTTSNFPTFNETSECVFRNAPLKKDKEYLLLFTCKPELQPTVHLALSLIDHPKQLAAQKDEKLSAAMGLTALDEENLAKKLHVPTEEITAEYEVTREQQPYLRERVQDVLSRLGKDDLQTEVDASIYGTDTQFDMWFPYPNRVKSAFDPENPFVTPNRFDIVDGRIKYVWKWRGNQGWSLETLVLYGNRGVTATIHFYPARKGLERQVVMDQYAIVKVCVTEYEGEALRRVVAFSGPRFPSASGLVTYDYSGGGAYPVVKKFSGSGYLRDQIIHEDDKALQGDWLKEELSVTRWPGGRANAFNTGALEPFSLKPPFSLCPEISRATEETKNAP